MHHFMKRFSFLLGTSSLFLLFLVNGPLFGQNADGEQNGERAERYCATDQMLEKRLEEASPQERRAIEDARQELEEMSQEEGERAGQVYTVPVVFHVIHDNGPENIPRENIEDVMEILNRDFRKNNADTSSIVSPFASIAADIEIEFRLAQKDPNGNCHPGITRTRSDRTYDGDDNMKNLIQWDPSKYMNVWISNTVQGGAAGYTYQPYYASFNPDIDGIVLQYDYVGSLSPSSYGKSRTLTHEVGHYFNLDHPWGGQNAGQPGSSSNPDNCNYDDNVGDTPTTIGWTSCDLNGSSCGDKDNVQNFMSYSYCHRMFTEGQRTRMRNAIESSIADRNNLWKDANLQETGVKTDVLCKADLEADNRVVCPGESVQFFDLSYHGANSWDWQFEGGNANSTTVENPSVTYNSTGTYDVSLTVSNNSNSKSITLQDYISVIDSNGFALPWVKELEYMSTMEDHPEFFVKNYDKDQVAWKHTTQAGEGQSSGSVMLQNYNNDAGAVDAFTTTTMDASGIPSGDLELSFDVAYAKTSSGDQDELKVYASKDCGNSWSLRGTFTASDIATGPDQTVEFYPANSEWTRKVINSSLVGSYNVSNLRFKFEFISDGGNNVFIDNINVHGQQNASIADRNEEVPSMSLSPNPVKETAVLELELPDRERISIDILDLRGKKVRTVEKGKELSKGDHRIHFDTQTLSTGAYFLRLKAGGHRSSTKLFKR